MGMLTFLDWGLLGTFSGAVGLTVIIVQMLKLPLDRVWRVPTRFLVYIVCFTIMLLAQVFVGEQAFTVQIVAITALNAVLGTLTAMALYEQVIELPERQKLIGAYQYMTTGQMPADGEIDQAAIGVKATDREGETKPETVTNDGDEDEEGDT